MKQRILAIAVIAVFYLSSCHKESSVNPYIATEQGTEVLPTTGITLGNGKPTSTVPVPDTVKGFFVVKLDKDSINTDGLIIEFDPKSSAAYSGGEDAPYLQGYGQVGFFSFSSDNIALSINTLPLYQKGTTVRLSVSAKTNGVYKLNLTKIQSIPSTYDIWLMDKYRKDSLDFRHNPVYLFDRTSDTSSYGSNRFTIVTRLH